MKVTIRGVDPAAYRQLKARALHEGRPIGTVLSRIILDRDRPFDPLGKAGSMSDIKPVNFGKGTEQLSEQVDEIVYGIPPRNIGRLNAYRSPKRPPPKRGHFVDHPQTVVEISARGKSEPARRRPSRR